MQTHLALALILGAVAVSAPPARVAPPAPEPPVAHNNDYTHSAGKLSGGVLSVSLVAEVARWFPGPDSAPPFVVELFGEEGQAPSNPGPLLRFPLGTRVDLKIRNTLPDTMFFAAACGFPCKRPDTLHIAPGRTGRLQFTPLHPGTFTYWGAALRGGKPYRLETDGSQFNGVIVVDSGPAVKDRIITISFYDRERDPADSSSKERVLFALNGASWPYNSRPEYTVGDSVHWRIVNLSGVEHPMHLHGFYFRVESRGDGTTDHAIAKSRQPLVVTEQVGTLGTFRITWSPDRAGNWLFHCHRPAHMAGSMMDAIFDRSPTHETHHMEPTGDHAMTEMAGLVLGITVKPAPGPVAAGSPEPGTTNHLRLVVKKLATIHGPEAMFGYMLEHPGDTTKATPAQSPGPVIAVTRGERTIINVVNQLAEPTSVHWHGIELESFYDGVPGWSGDATRIEPMIAAGDSFMVVFTPPRAGTFMYHTHTDDIHQLTAGLYGPLIVLEPGKKWDPETDHVFGLGQDGDKAPSWNVLNGAPAVEPLHFKAGVAHRLRFYNMTTDDEADLYLETDSGFVKWTPVAKDGMPIVAAERVPKPAKLHIGPGETFDFQFTPKPGDYRLRVMSFSNILFSIVAR